MKRLSLLLAITLLPGASFGGNPPEFSKSLVIDKLKEDLVDPDSAKFRKWSKLKRNIPVTQEHKDKTHTYNYVWHGCVEMNVKNKLGGYTGYKTYEFNAFDDGSWRTSTYIPRFATLECEWE